MLRFNLRKSVLKLDSVFFRRPASQLFFAEYLSAKGCFSCDIRFCRNYLGLDNRNWASSQHVGKLEIKKKSTLIHLFDV